MAEPTETLSPKVALERYRFLKESGALDATITKFALAAAMIGKSNHDEVALTISTVAASAVDPGESIARLNATAALFLAAAEMRKAAEQLSAEVRADTTCNCPSCRAERDAKGGAS